MRERVLLFWARSMTWTEKTKKKISERNRLTMRMSFFSDIFLKLNIRSGRRMFLPHHSSRDVGCDVWWPHDTPIQYLYKMKETKSTTANWGIELYYVLLGWKNKILLNSMSDHIHTSHIDTLWKCNGNKYFWLVDFRPNDCWRRVCCGFDFTWFG